jgi:hypothetical protein
LNGKDFKQASISGGLEKRAPAIAAQGSEPTGAAKAPGRRTRQTPRSMEVSKEILLKSKLGRALLCQVFLNDDGNGIWTVKRDSLLAGED